MIDAAALRSRDARAAWLTPGPAWVLLAILVLLPFGSAAEVPVLAGAIAALVAIVRRRIDWRASSTRLALVLFGAYWLPELLSAFDSYAPSKSWLESAADLRFGLLLLFAAQMPQGEANLRAFNAGVALLLALWCVDALVQAATGWSLGGAGRVDRLSGIFGDDNLKLGGVIATLSPFGLLWAWRRYGLKGAIVALLPILLVVLLAGARASWIALALVLAMVAWCQFGARRGAPALVMLTALALLAGLSAYTLSERFAERVTRTSALLHGERDALDYALAGRLPIWDTALTMSAAHPVNGVGVRAFRYAYPEYAAPGDTWVDAQRGTGAMHAHQWVLEVLSETGGIGLLCWLVGFAFGWKAWRTATPAARERARAPACALAAMLFPLNTHYAVYSNFWSMLLFAMLAAWIAALRGHDGSSR